MNDNSSSVELGASTNTSAHVRMSASTHTACTRASMCTQTQMRTHTHRDSFVHVLALAEKVQAYDAVAAARHHEAHPDPTMSIDRIHDIVYEGYGESPTCPKKSESCCLLSVVEYCRNALCYYKRGVKATPELLKWGSFLGLVFPP